MTPLQRLAACLVVVWSCGLAALAAPAPSFERAAETGLSGSLPALTRGPLAMPTAIGPYAVGRRTVAYVDFTRENRLLVMDVWYPVERADATAGTQAFYDLVFATLDSPLARQNAPAAAGPFPLLVFSHGNQGIRFQSFSLTEALASQGFVVVATDHAGNTAQDLVFDTLEPFAVSAVNRPIDISFTVDRMLENNVSAGNFLEGRIDSARIGALGHSFGGYTALAVASGIDEWPRDTRISVLGAIAPASGINSDAALQSIGLPTLILGGTSDTTTPIDDQSTRPFELIPAMERLRVDLQAAGHQSFTDICVFTETLLDAGIDPMFAEFLLGNAEEGCAPELLPIARAHELSRLYLVAYFKRHLLQDTRFDLFLTSGFAIGKGLEAEVFTATP